MRSRVPPGLRPYPPRAPGTLPNPDRSRLPPRRLGSRSGLRSYDVDAFRHGTRVETLDTASKRLSVPKEMPPTEFKTKKALILMSSIGRGHASAAEAIRESVLRKDPDVPVDIIDIRSFMKSDLKRTGDEKVYWWLVKKHPKAFTWIYQQGVQKGERATNLDRMLAYDLEAVRRHIEKGGYDVVVAVHYGAANVLHVLRERGLLGGVRSAWLNTDYIKNYFPRFALDAFFLGHDALARDFTEAGVESTRARVSGIPVSEKLFSPFDPAEFRRSEGLSPDIKTVVIGAGAEGVADFPRMVKELAKSESPLQIVAITANNVRAHTALTALKLPPHITLLAPKGLIPNERVLGFIRSADLFVTKSGGLMPTEAFVAGVPTLLLDVYGGHESENARFLEAQGLGVVVDAHYSGFSDKAFALLQDESQREKFIAAAGRFRAQHDVGKIADFILDPADRHRALGELGGTPVQGVHEALATLDGTAPDLEILLSQAKGRSVWKDDNPFGHLALAVEGEVHTMNGVAGWRSDALVHRSSLSDYLYGVTDPATRADFTDAFGEAYGRSVIGLRVRGLRPDEKAAIRRELDRIEREWESGRASYDKMESNCADMVLRALSAAGFSVDMGRGVTFPLSAFDRLLDQLTKAFPGRVEVVKYEKVPGAANQYKVEDFPVNAASALVHRRNRDHHLGLVSKVVRFDPKSQSLGVEGTGRGLSFDPLARVEARHRDLAALAERLAHAEMRVAWLHDQATERRRPFEQALDRIAGMGLTPPEIEAAVRGETLPGWTEEDAAEFRKAAWDIRKFHRAVTRFHVHYDRVTSAKNEWLMHLVRNDLAGLLVMLRGRPDVPEAKKTVFGANIERIDALFQEYSRLKHLAGVSPGDGKRVLTLRKFYEASRSLAGELEMILRGSSWPLEYRRPADRALQRVLHSIHTLATYVGLLPAAAKMLGSLYLPEGTLDFAGGVVDAYSRLAKASKLDVTVERMGELDASRHILYAISHRNPYGDHMSLLPFLPRKDVAFVGQDDAYGFKHLRPRIHKDKGFIPVGGSSANPIEQIHEALASRDVVLYPEGSVTTPLGETRPLRPNFSRLLLPALLTGVDEGLGPKSGRRWDSLDRGAKAPAGGDLDGGAAEGEARAFAGATAGAGDGYGGGGEDGLGTEARGSSDDANDAARLITSGHPRPGERAAVGRLISKRRTRALPAAQPFQIVPVTLADPAVRLYEDFDPCNTRKKVRVIMHDAIPSEKAALLMTLLPNRDTLAQWIRLIWHDDLRRDEEPMPGQLPVWSIIEREQDLPHLRKLHAWALEDSAHELASNDRAATQSDDPGGRSWKRRPRFLQPAGDGSAGI